MNYTYSCALIFLCFVAFSARGQQATRVSVNGTIKAPVGEIVEGVHIYNISSQKGAITDFNGAFLMAMAITDRILVTAIQYKEFTVVVDQGIIDKKEVNIYLNPMVNELDEVVVSPYDLSGNIAVDVGKIETTNYSEDVANLSYEQLRYGKDMAADNNSSIKGNQAKNAYHNGQTQNGLSLVKGFNFLKHKIFGKSKNKQTAAQLEKEAALIANGIRGRFTNQFLMDNYHIPTEFATDFVYYVQESGIPITHLKPENELLLLDYLNDKAVECINKINE